MESGSAWILVRPWFIGDKWGKICHNAMLWSGIECCSVNTTLDTFSWTCRLLWSLSDSHFFINIYYDYSKSDVLANLALSGHMYLIWVRQMCYRSGKEALKRLGSIGKLFQLGFQASRQSACAPGQLCNQICRSPNEESMLAPDTSRDAPPKAWSTEQILSLLIGLAGNEFIKWRACEVRSSFNTISSHWMGLRSVIAWPLL